VRCDRFHRLRTYHGTTVSVRREDGLLINSVEPKRHEQLADVFLFIPDSARRLGFLLFDLPVNRTISMGAPEPIDPVLSLRISHAAELRHVMMSSPTTGLFMTASPPDTEIGAGGMFLAASLPQLWEQFHLEAVEPGDVPKRLSRLHP
jgi:hypothetical protein